MIMNKKAKIVMITMFKNEARGLPTMLESCKPYVDYYVMQNNGSTDGSDEIARKFLEDNNLPGVIYDVEEGWIGFGWNRDHLIQYCQEQTDHGCDWILKMDCDEVLEVDPDFDWSLLDDKSIQSFHITAITGNCIYHRAWMWNAKLKWRFNHDDAHETIRLVDPDVGEGFQRIDLPKSFRQIGYNIGESWTVPTKFASHALVLEEKLLRENTMLTDLYHFWYIGKSYNDTYRGDFFPLKKPHQLEYAKRCIFYLTEYVKYMHQNGPYHNEMSYISLVLVGEAHEYIGDDAAALTMFEYAGQFCPPRNEHLFGAARVYEKFQKYDKMYEIATRMMDPERKIPFPNCNLFIDQSIYVDSTQQRVQELFVRAKRLFENQTKEEDILKVFNIKKSTTKRMFIVDNFYDNPDEIREFALKQEFKEDIRWYKGMRTTRCYRTEAMKRAFENIMGEKIYRWNEYDMNGVFQITTANDVQVYHHDVQKWAAMIYLTPNAPLESGTRLHKSKINGVNHYSQGNILIDEAFSSGFYDSTKFHLVDSAGNVYNRLVIMDAMHIHSAGPYFGTTPETGRLTHLFFFD
jgi:glycosyltransferase involved in cell wall biosynthesis